MTTAWDPDQYRRFAAERAQPFHDLLDLVRPGTIGRAVDLGAGDASLSLLAAERLGIGSLTVVDNSAGMLASARERTAGRTDVTVAAGDIAAWTAHHDHDLVLSNAALHWVPDHPTVLARWTAALAPGGQLAVQVPANAGHPSHLVAAEVAASAEFAGDFGPAGPPPDVVAVNVLAPESYAELLHELGFVEQHVRLQVYTHLLPDASSVVEWVKGTTLTRFKEVMAPARYEQFVERYREVLLARLGDEQPFFYPFRRILFWGRLAG